MPEQTSHRSPMLYFPRYVIYVLMGTSILVNFGWEWFFQTFGWVNAADIVFDQCWVLLVILIIGSDYRWTHAPPDTQEGSCDEP